MALDPKKNFAKASVVSGDYGIADTEIDLVSGGAARIYDAPFTSAFDIVWWNSTDYKDPADDPKREIVRITGITDDTLTITRAQQGTSASTKNTSEKVYKVHGGVTKKDFDDIQTLISAGGNSDGDGPPVDDPDPLPATGKTVYYWDYTNKANYVWDRQEEAWIQIS